MAETIVIDAGHGGSDPGAVYNGRQEKDDTLRLALEIGRILENNGLNVVYTRTEDVYDSPYKKAQIANNADGDYFVSLHRNSSRVPGEYAGVQTLVYDNSGIKVELAEKVNEKLALAGFDNLGISVRPDLIVLNSTDMPAILIEAGFINTAGDNQVFDEKFTEVATGIADAIIETVQQSEGGNYYVQSGLYRVLGNARAQADRLWYYGYPADIDMYNNLYRVIVGPFDSMEDATDAERGIRNLGFQTLVIEKK